MSRDREGVALVTVGVVILLLGIARRLDVRLSGADSEERNGDAGERST